jgi:hypothetical protein
MEHEQHLIDAESALVTSDASRVHDQPLIGFAAQQAADADDDDPRHKTYKPYLAHACLIGFLLFTCQLIAGLTVLPDESQCTLAARCSCSLARVILINRMLHGE